MTQILEDQVVGNDFDLQADVPGVDPTDRLVKAWCTVKVNRSDADPGALQKIISATPVAGVGQIAQSGAAGDGDGTGSVLFQFTAAETTALGTSIRYFYEIQGKATSGKIYTGRNSVTGMTIGRLQLKPRLTGATT